MDRREELFAQAIVRGLGRGAAATEAGYSVQMSAKLWKRESVQQRIKELDDEIRQRKAGEFARVVVPTRDWVLRELIENVNESKAAKDRASVNRGLELVGKEIGMFVTRSMQIDSPLQRLPAASLVQLLALIDKALPNPDALPALSAPREVTIDATVEPSSEATDDVW
jgi:hypothetical protein